MYACLPAPALAGSNHLTHSYATSRRQLTVGTPHARLEVQLRRPSAVGRTKHTHVAQAPAVRSQHTLPEVAHIPACMHTRTPSSPRRRPSLPLAFRLCTPGSQRRPPNAQSSTYAPGRPAAAQSSPRIRASAKAALPRLPHRRPTAERAAGNQRMRRRPAGAIARRRGAQRPRSACEPTRLAAVEGLRSPGSRSPRPSSRWNRHRIFPWVLNCTL